MLLQKNRGHTASFNFYTTVGTNPWNAMELQILQHFIRYRCKVPRYLKEYRITITLSLKIIWKSFSGRIVHAEFTIITKFMRMCTHTHTHTPLTCKKHRFFKENKRSVPFLRILGFKKGNSVPPHHSGQYSFELRGTLWKISLRKSDLRSFEGNIIETRRVCGNGTLRIQRRHIY